MPCSLGVIQSPPLPSQVERLLEVWVRRTRPAPQVVPSTGRRPTTVQIDEWPSAEKSHEKQSARILLAEDNRINQQVALAMIRKIGLEADAVGSGDEVLRAMAERNYDLILMDCQMPGMDGFEATAKVRRRNKERWLPIIALTADAMTGTRERCLASGMDDYLSKPLHLNQLKECIEHWLYNPPSEKIQTPARKGSLNDSDPELFDHAILVTHLRRDSARGEGISGEPLLQQWLLDTRDAIEGIHRAAAMPDWERVLELGYAIRTSSLNVGAREVAAVTAGLEQAALARRSSEINPLLARLSEALRRAERFIQTLVP